MGQVERAVPSRASGGVRSDAKGGPRRLPQRQKRPARMLCLGSVSPLPRAFRCDMRMESEHGCDWSKTHLVRTTWGLVFF